MFKYISEILAQFSKPQKILALLLVLFSIVVITISPSLISALTVNCEELEIRVERQSKRIGDLENLIDTLDFKIRTNQRKCTNEITSREMEFLEMLEELKSDIRRSERISMAENTKLLNTNYTQDTIVGSEINQIQPPTPKKNPMKGMVEKIEKMQDKIKH
jgi:hypothetical protein